MGYQGKVIIMVSSYIDMPTLLVMNLELGWFFQNLRYMGVALRVSKAREKSLKLMLSPGTMNKTRGRVGDNKEVGK